MIISGLYRDIIEKEGIKLDNLEKEIKRKIRNRKVAIENLGISKSIALSNLNDIGETNNEIQLLYSQLTENIQEADQSHIQDGYFPITSKRRVTGKFIVFIKKCIRKLINISFGWYIKPILEKQSYYNGKLLNSVNLMNNILVLQEQHYNQKINEIEMRFAKMESKSTLDTEISKKIEYILNRLNVSCDINLLEHNNMDYFKFEDAFRGTRSGVKALQSAYKPYFMVNGNAPILDIGCGRGEFLELMWDNGIPAYGIDLYEPFVKYCKERGFNVQLGDALTHLNALEDCTLGGIFMSQVIEHLSSDYVIALITTAYKKLMPGCYFILETPNPDCLAALSEFNIDMSHIKPVHYKAIEYLFKEANYQSVERHHNEQTLYPVRAKHIDAEHIKNVNEFNQGIDHINELLFGYRDYTLIAKK